jgi:hypothetical protein
MTNRLVLFVGSCLLLALWLYPQIETNYSSWDNEEHRWIPFKTFYHRDFLTNVGFSTQRIPRCP